MAKVNKDTTKQTEDSTVEKRVDAMMDPRVKDGPGSVIEPDAANLPPLDIYAEPTSAPPLVDKIEQPEKIDTPEKEEPAEVAQVEPPAEPVVETDDTPPADVEVKPLNIDTAQSDAAIDDIVAQEADVVLAAEDANIAVDAETVAASVPDVPKKRGHPVFWFIVFMLVILCVVAGVMLTNPNVSLPFSA